MTVKEALDLVQALRPHAYPAQALLRELSSLDGRIWKEIWQGRQGAAADIPKYTEEHMADTALLAEEPYAQMYPTYLMAQIALWDGETERFNQLAMVFNGIYEAYRACISREAPWKNGRKLFM